VLQDSTLYSFQKERVSRALLRVRCSLLPAPHCTSVEPLRPPLVSRVVVQVYENPTEVIDLRVFSSVKSSGMEPVNWAVVCAHLRT
jgi:hypothetical protein